MNPSVYVLPEFWCECGQKLTSKRVSDRGLIYYEFSHPATGRDVTGCDEPCSNEGNLFPWRPIMEMRFR